MNKRIEFKPKTKAEALLIFKGRCAYCKEKLGGTKDPTEYDHKHECWEYEKYGWDTKDLDSVENCLPCHKSCHSFKSKKSTAERAKGKRQLKRAGGAAGGRTKATFPSGAKIQSGGFNYPPDYKHNWSKK